MAAAGSGRLQGVEFIQGAACLDDTPGRDTEDGYILAYVDDMLIMWELNRSKQWQER